MSSSSRITAHSDTNHGMADALQRGAQEKRQHTDDHHRGAEFIYQNDLTDSFGQSYYEQSGQTQALSNETWDTETAQARAVVNANDHLMDAVRRAQMGMR
ncbi:hypothetical protein GCM10027290_55210 [Micromonospora sonneratiae]|uniref:Uncharacterized protein n=1 Tax=Micromonospora sonneratiae TaxID=1184706 RepID=A0ABW3YS85_9ACTN